MNNRRRSKTRATGAALPLVLWAVLVLSVTIIVTAQLVDFDIESEKAAGERFRARQAALTGLALAMHPEVERGDPLLAQTMDDGTAFEVLIASEDARLNINRLLLEDGERTLELLFRHWDLPEVEALTAVDSLKDWVDGDDFRSLHGAEYQDIPEDSGWQRPENRPFFSIAEMERVRGMEYVGTFQPDWMQYFSVHSSGQLDIRDVSEDLLQVVGGLTPEQARSIVVYRNGVDETPGTEDDNPLDSIDMLEGIIGLSPPQLAALGERFGTDRKTLRIVSVGSAGEMRYEIAAVVRSNGDILEWHEQ